MSRRPLLLDLFCGAGGAAMGYHRAGFDVVGIDIEPQHRYPFPWYRAPWQVGLAELGPVADVIHASPPCQAHSSITQLDRALFDHLFDPHADELTPCLEALRAQGRPWVVENVPTAKPMPASSVTVCGSAFGLRVRRHRRFASSWPLAGTVCRHAEQGQPLGVYGHGGGRQGGAIIARRADFAELMGMPWADWQGARKAIPPAYTEYIGAQLLAHLDEEVPA